jgi:hypothetical protein
MVNSDNHENEQLANRLTAAADGIVNSAAAGLERDLRAAAQIVRGADRPATVPVIPVLVSELARIANHCPDADTRRRLRRLIGEAQQ